jgi:hypothetical protein
MAIISAKFGDIVKNTGEDSIPWDSYFGVCIYAYRRKRNISRKQLSILWGMSEDGLLRVEYGFGSAEEVKRLLPKIRAENKRAC